MQVRRAYDFIRNDCTMDIECEHCGNVSVDKSAYNDEYYRTHVVPKRYCEKCGKNAVGTTKKYEEMENAAIKYAETQDKSTFHACKTAYMAGAQDFGL